MARASRTTWARRVAVAAGFVTLFAVTWWVAARNDVSSADDLVALVRDPLDALGWLRLPVTLALATALLVALVPSPIVFGAVGIALGTWEGLAVGILALGIAVVIDRFIGRTLVGEWLQARMARSMPQVDRRITRYGFPGVVVARLVGTPPALIGWASSATSLTWWQVSVGCMVGTLPRGFAYVAIGASGGALWPPGDWTTEVIVSFVVLGLAAIASVLLALHARTRGSDDDIDGAAAA